MVNDSTASKDMGHTLGEGESTGLHLPSILSSIFNVATQINAHPHYSMSIRRQYIQRSNGIEKGYY